VKARKRWGRGVKRGGVGAEEGWEWKEKRRRRGVEEEGGGGGGGGGEGEDMGKRGPKEGDGRGGAPEN
jgi:hypothetical protein